MCMRVVLIYPNNRQFGEGKYELVLHASLVFASQPVDIGKLKSCFTQLDTSEAFKSFK